ncbi:uncharacterized protein RJT21DRAFT_31634 [Scheffersomyces amazonensis]|uniref:uncharacterized protein n=1 Tax=Scheffersomyces amazonensis TaxID=1078765 RepID=UPI00315DF665
MAQQLPSVSELITTTNIPNNNNNQLNKQNTTPSPASLPKKLSISPPSPRSIIPRIPSNISYSSLPHPPIRRLTEPSLGMSRSTSQENINGTNSINTSPSSVNNDFYNYRMHSRESISSSVDPLQRSPNQHHNGPPPPQVQQHQQMPSPHHLHQHQHPQQNPNPYPPVYYAHPPPGMYVEGNNGLQPQPSQSPPGTGYLPPGYPMQAPPGMYPPPPHHQHPQAYQAYYPAGQIPQQGPPQGPPLPPSQVPQAPNGLLPHQQDGRRNHQQHHTLQHHQHVPIPSHIHFDENQALVNKRRIIKRRTRTGCLTCRKRRIKCDERKPTCFNCERSKKVCLGYENLSNLGSTNGIKRKKNSTVSIDTVDFRSPLPPPQHQVQPGASPVSDHHFQNPLSNGKNTGHYHHDQIPTSVPTNSNTFKSSITDSTSGSSTTLPSLSLPPPIKYSRPNSSSHFLSRPLGLVGGIINKAEEPSTSSEAPKDRYLPSTNYSMNKVSVHDLIR